MENFKTALARFIENSGMTPAQICKQVRYTGGKITESAISQALSGGIALTPDTIFLIAPILRLDEKQIEELLLLSLKVKAKGDESSAFVEEMINRAAKDKNSVGVAIKEKAEVPIYGSIKAGSADLSADAAQIVGVTKMDQEEQRRGYFVMLVSGDSMEPEVMNGDLAFIAPYRGDPVSERDIYVIEAEGWPQWMLKRVRQLPGGKVGLISTNQSCKIIEVDPIAQRFKIKGKLMHTRREFSKSFVV